MMASITMVRAVRKAALDLLYPPRCGVCGRGGSFLCDRCSKGLLRADGARCDACWLPLHYGHCLACRERELPLRVRSAFRYEGDVRRLVHAFKFSGQSCLAPALAAQLIDCFDRFGLDADLIVPVPLTGRRRRLRGFNQSLLLAQELGRARSLPVTEALRRRGHAAPQAGSSSAEERKRNVEGVFDVAKAEAVAERRVLLVDDVATTCATLSACAEALLSAGAASVIGLTLARED